MNEYYVIGGLMIFIAGSLLHDVPFHRFLPALMLVSIGTILFLKAGLQ